jgi:hypothetical protein
MARRNRNAGLDPETRFEEIYRNLATYEFPWDLSQALSFALFRTYAVPGIGRLLDETGAFTGNTQKRYDDTALLLEAPLRAGFRSADGKTAVRRINQMHHRYDIPNDEFRYVLSTFVVVPARWIEQYGWRRLTDSELLASVRYYQTLGRHLGITGIPSTYAGFETLMDEYEAAHFAFDPGARRVADATLALLASFYPRFARPAVRLFSRALMDQPLLAAFAFETPGRFTRSLSVNALRLRGRFVALLPPRRKPLLAQDMRRIRSYPGGFGLENLGTFPQP